MNQELDHSGDHRNWDKVTHAEKYFPDINDQIVLRTPHGWYRLTSTEKVAIGVYFKGLLGLTASSKLIGIIYLIMSNGGARCAPKAMPNASGVGRRMSRYGRRIGMRRLQG